MKQLVQKLKSGEMQVLDVPVPDLQPGRILVRVRFSLISAGTEGNIVAAARKSYAGKARENPRQFARVVESLRTAGPVQTYRQVMSKLDSWSPLGYSCAGEVIGVGEGVTGFAVGDLAACGGTGAGHAEAVLVPANLAVRLQPDDDLAKAAYNTLGAVALQGVRQADLRLGESCVVVGLGLLGQLTVMLLKASGVRVCGIDVGEEPVAMAAKSGADLALVRSAPGLAETIDEATGGVGADAVIITAAGKTTDPVNLAGRLARKRGRVVIVGDVLTGFDRDPHWYRKELELRMACSYGPGRYDPEYEEKGTDYPVGYVRWTEKRNMEAFQELVRTGRVDPSLLTTQVYDLDDAPAAYDAIAAGRRPLFGLLIRYGGEEREEERTVETKPAKALAKINVGFIGAGSYAQSFLLPNLPKDGSVRLAGLLASSGAGARSGAERFGFEFCTTYEEAICGSEEIDTVFVATRHDSHARYVTAALTEGKNVYVEKPLCLTEAELDEIRGVYEEAERPFLMIGFNRRFAPLTGMLRERIAGAPMVMLYRVNAGPLPPDHWALDPDVGGGRIVGEACHFIDYLTCVNGSLPVTVQAAGLRDSAGWGETAAIVISFANGSVGTVHYCSNSSRGMPKEYVEISAAGVTAALTDFRELEVYGEKRDFRKKLAARDKGQKEMLAAFTGALLQGRESPIPFDEIVAVTRASFAAAESIRTGQPVRI